MNKLFILFALAGLLVVFAPISAQANMGDSIIYTCDDLFFGFGENVELDYTIDGGNVVYTCLEEGYPAVELYMRIEADSDGQITVEIPRTMVYFVNQDCESQDLIILVNDEEANYNVENTPLSRIITLDFPTGDNLIEFIGSFTTGDDVHQYCGVIYGYDSQYLSPKKQIDKGRLSENVRCNEGLELIFKSTDYSPACVKPQTAEKLIERGWGTYN